MKEKVSLAEMTFSQNTMLRKTAFGDWANIECLLGKLRVELSLTQWSMFVNSASFIMTFNHSSEWAGSNFVNPLLHPHDKILFLLWWEDVLTVLKLRQRTRCLDLPEVVSRFIASRFIGWCEKKNRKHTHTRTQNIKCVVKRKRRKNKYNSLFPAHQSQTKYFSQTFCQIYLWPHQLQKRIDKNCEDWWAGTKRIMMTTQSGSKLSSKKEEEGKEEKCEVLIARTGVGNHCSAHAQAQAHSRPARVKGKL